MVDNGGKYGFLNLIFNNTVLSLSWLRDEDCIKILSNLERLKKWSLSIISVGIIKKLCHGQMDGSESYLCDLLSELPRPCLL